MKLQLFMGGALIASVLTAFAQDEDAGTRNYGGDAPEKVENLLYKPTYNKCMQEGKNIVTRKDIYKDGWIDLNKNGTKDVYEDPTQPVEKRITNLISQMTDDEKTAQMVTLYGYSRVCRDFLPTKKWPTEELWKDGIGAIDEHLNGFNYFMNKKLPGAKYIWPASKHAWALNEVQRFFVEDTRLGIPVDFTNEGIRGIENVKATNFPTQLAIGTTWNKDLVRKVGEVTGSEARALGYTNCYSPIMDVIRDQRWGRCEECYGESPWLASEMGIEMVKGIQSKKVAATMKHYGIYSDNKGAREGFARVDPQCGPREAEYVHLWAFERVIKGSNALGVMASYNDYAGIPIIGSRYYMHDVLRERMGFKGYVVSDSGAVSYLHGKHRTSPSMKESVYKVVKAGLDVRCTFAHPKHYLTPLRELVKEGRLTQDDLNDRLRCILRVKFFQGRFDAPYEDIKNADKEVMCKKNLDISRQVSREALVLLKNKNNALPLDISKIKSICVTGPNAADRDYALGHYGPLDVEVTTVLKGLQDKCKNKGIEVKYVKGCDRMSPYGPDNEIMWMPPTAKEQKGIDEAVEVAKQCDVTICVVGDLPYGKGSQATSGENKSRTSLNLTGRQDDLIRSLADKSGKPVIVVHVSGRPNAINWAQKKADAILHTFYPGAFGGEAVAETLFGEYNPGGHLPCTFAKSAGQMKLNFPATPNSQSGYNNISTNGPLYPFGYGLSYTTFGYKNIKVDWAGKAEGKKPTINTPFTVSCDVTNTGDRDGNTVVQMYVRDEVSSTITYELLLRGFERVYLKKGETKTVTFKVEPQESLWLLDTDMKRVVEPGRFKLHIGNSSVFPARYHRRHPKKGQIIDPNAPAIKLSTHIDLVAK